MGWLLTIVIVILLAVLIYQDFRYREVYWFIIPLLIIFQGIESYRVIGERELIINSTVNLSLLLLQFLLLTLYFSFRNNRITNIINKYIGIGDIFFFIFLSLAFSTFNFIAFFIASLLIALVVYFITVKNNLGKYKIPLLGNMSITYLLVLIIQQISGFDKFDDAFFIDLFL